MPEADPAYTSDLTRRLVDDADLVTRLAPGADALPPDEEARALDGLVQEYDRLDAGLRAELATLAGLLTDAEGHALRAAVCRPGRAAVTVSPDRMTAALEVHPPEGGGRPVTAADVVELLKAEGVVVGVDLAAVRQAVEDGARPGRSAGAVVVAAGRPPVPGAAGRLETATPPDPAAGPREVRQWAVRAGDLVVRVVPPTAGEPGVTVCGESLPAAAGPAAGLAAAAGARLDAAAGGYVAEIDGMARFDGRTLEVRRHLVWPGDLTVHDTPIAFDGTVQVRGTVRDGARVEATEDVEVLGGVEGATVVSTGGSVTVRQGVAGRGRGFVAAKGRVEARYFENATVFAEGDVVARHAALHSRLTAGGRVRAELDKGAIVGGEVKAGAGVCAKAVGNAAGVPTKVAVGYDWPTLARLRALEAETAGLRQRAAACEAVIAGFRRARPNAAQLSADERRALCAVLKRHLALEARLRRAAAECREWEVGAARAGVGEVVCREGLYAGVLLKVGPAAAQLAGGLPACTVRLTKDGRRLEATGPAGRTLPLPV